MVTGRRNHESGECVSDGAARKTKPKDGLRRDMVLCRRSVINGSFLQPISDKRRRVGKESDG